VRATWLGSIAVACALAVTAGAARSDGGSSHPLATGVVDPFVFPSRDGPIGFSRTRAAGATFVRIALDWSGVVGNSKTRPKSLRATDPEDPHYDWAGWDRQLKLADENHLEPILLVGGFPQWARKRYGKDVYRPDPVAFGEFMTAVARHYSGDSDDVPRVRYWQIWNEPNHVGQKNLKEGAADWYRDLVNRAAAAVHGVHDDNLVIAGNTSPFTRTTAVGPLFFMRQLLCLRDGATKPPTCDKPIHFDIWAHHPYTAGGPTHHAADSDSVSIGDLPEMKRLLDAAVRNGEVISSHRPIPFWVTEFSWDTNPPDPQGVPIKLQVRWVAEALYNMWKDGVSLVVWWRIRDDPVGKSFYQSGLYARGPTIKSDHPKLTFYAFRFPFVAYPAESGRVSVWGRTPWSRSGGVVVEQEVGTEWESVGKFDADDHGIFSGYVRRHGDGRLRAHLDDGSAYAYPFALQEPPAGTYLPFGS
jgi:hypothetical protein